MYKNDKIWKKLQPFLPLQNQLTDELLPEETFYRIDNFNIHIDQYVSTNKSNISIVLFHGVGGNGRLLSFLAVPLQKHGYEVICPDMPGYGFTEYTNYPTYSDWIHIGQQIVDRKIKENKQVFLIGLSAGGMLAYTIACKCRNITGLIVTNILDNRLEIVRQYSAKSKNQAKTGFRILSQMPECIKKIKIPISSVTNMNALVNNKKILNLLIKDKRGAGSNVQINFLLTMMNHIPEIEPENFKKIPVLLCHPGNDKWTPTKLSELFFDRIQAEKNKIILQNCGHFPLEYPGIVTLENEIIKFMNKHTSSTNTRQHHKTIS